MYNFLAAPAKVFARLKAPNEVMVAQLSLFEDSPCNLRDWQVLPLPDGDFRLLPAFLDPEEAQALFAALHEAIPWQQDQITMYGKTHPVPRLHQWFGAEARPYRWSGITMASQPWPPSLKALCFRVEQAVGASFNSVLANLYRDGQDSVGWHADDEADFGPNPTIASISLGAERPFALRHRTNLDFRHHLIALPAGSLLVMGGRSQACWVHSLPRRKRVRAPRINLTFRQVRTAEL